MTDSTPADRFAWRTSADHRDEETREGTRFYTDRA
jgi:hypothetical protein